MELLKLPTVSSFIIRHLFLCPLQVIISLLFEIYHLQVLLYLIDSLLSQRLSLNSYYALLQYLVPKHNYREYPKGVS